MKFTQTAAAVAVYALVNNVSAIRLADIFDSYDEETKKEAQKKDQDGNVDAAALAKEINGDQIKAEVKAATSGVANQQMLQTQANINLGFIDDVDSIYVASEDVYLQRDIVDKDGDGVEDNKYYTSHELDKFIKPWVYGDVEEMHNTRNGELPGHHLKNDHPEPKGFHASHVIDSRPAELTSAQVVAAAKAAAPAEEPKAAPAAEGEAAAAPAEDKPAEEKKVQMSDAISEIDERAQNDNDAAPAELAQKQAEEAHPTSKEPMPIGKKMAKIDPEVAAQIQEGEVQAAAAAAKNERAQNDYDTEYLQIKLSSFMNQIQGPEDLQLVADDVSLLQTGWCRGCNKIYDADGDGVEDNRELTHDELDKFYIPNYFNTAEEIYNTRNGELPGHIQREFYEMQHAPRDLYSIRPWNWAQDGFW